jgi:hypothetical protein
MNRTLAFVVCAMCSVGAAAITHLSFKPATPSENIDVGEAFYPDFKDPLKATSLTVAAYNEKAAKVDTFAVEQKNGVWRIPSHHNYPADGKDRLARTAASLIGVERGQLVSTSAESHKRLDLLDPLDKSITGTEGRGTRITLKDGDTVLTDFIVGKKEEGSSDLYYIRRADEPRVYLANLQLDVSTKFVDWIQPNLLDATAANFRELIVDRYSVDEAKGAIVPGEQSHLTRESSTADWKLEELKDPEKQLKTSVVNAMTNTLADMKIVGVRPKPAGLGAQLKGEEGASVGLAEQLDMQDKGFFIDPRGRLLSNEGDFLAGTADGALYVLRFGEVFTGSDMEIEIGSPKSDEKNKPADTKDASKDDEKKSDSDPSKEEDGEKKEDEQKENRYVFITVQFDETLLGEVPKEPVKPTPPPGYEPTGDASKAPAADSAKPPETPAATEGAKPDEKSAEATEAPPAKETPATEESPAEKADAPKEEPSTSFQKKNSSAEQLSLAGPPSDPAPGVEVEEPAEEAPADATKAPVEEAPATEAPATETPAEEAPAPAATETPEQAPAPAADAAPEADAPAVEVAPNAEQPAAAAEAPKAPVDPNKAYEDALKKYEQEMDEYKVRKSEYDEKVKKGKARVQQLSNRFADWYYVISADVFESLNVKPEELVEPKTAAAASGTPGGSIPGLPAGFDPSSLIPGSAKDAPAAETTPPAVEDKPATETPAADVPATEAPATSDTAEKKEPATTPEPETPPATEEASAPKETPADEKPAEAP